MNNLNFISKENLKLCIQKVLKDLHSQKKTNLHKNVIDPFSAVFDSMIGQISIENWFQLEFIRQCQKTLQNRIGLFHQNVLSNCPGNEIPKDVFDLVNHKCKFVAEIKNKYNTLNSEGKKETYNKLAKVLEKTNSYYGYTAYYVEIIPDRSLKKYNIPFTPSDNHTGMLKQENPQIRRIDGASFYHLATGEPKALKKLYEILPLLIREIKQELITFPEQESHFEELFLKAFDS